MPTTRQKTSAMLIAGITALAAMSGAGATSSKAAELTLYRSDDAALFSSQGGAVDSGYAVAREYRQLDLTAGVHDVVIGNLPDFLDPEALSLSFPGDKAKVLSQRLLLAQGANASLTGLVGQSIEVLGSNGESLARGTLLRANGGLLVRDQDGGTTLVSSHAAVRTRSGDFPTGSSLNLRVDAPSSGDASAVLSYPTSGVGWRAAYVATLQPGNACRMQFESRASIANRSGRDWHDTKLTLVAGEPNMAKPSAPRVQAMAFSAKAADSAMPQQDSIGDYRSYSVPSTIDLPDGSVSLVPLYSTRTLDCTRTSLYENGNNYVPDQPMLNPNFNPGGSNNIISTLQWQAFDSLPAGYLRVLTADRNGTPQFIGEGRIDDTPKGNKASITLGTAFDLRGERTRTSFAVDKQGQTLNEAFRIELSNAGDRARVVTVREYPNRWREWKLVSSSSKPSSQTADTLEFRVEVPANGKATLNYAVRYSWTADQLPQ